MISQGQLSDGHETQANLVKNLTKIDRVLATATRPWWHTNQAQDNRHRLLGRPNGFLYSYFSARGRSGWSA
jgi:hypothetical protein